MNQEIEVYKLQYQQALDTYRTQFTLLINILTIFIIANVTLIGFAVDKKSSLMLLTGAIFPLAIHFAYRTIKELMKPIILTAIYFEKKNEYSRSKLTCFYIHELLNSG